MIESEFPPEELNSVVEKAYCNSPESEKYLNMLSNLKEEPFILDFIIRVFSLEIDSLSDNTLFYCILSARSFIRNNGPVGKDYSSFFMNFYLKSYQRFNSPALINESSLLFGAVFRSNEEDGCFVIKKISEQRNDLSLIYSAVLVSSISSQQSIRNIINFLNNYMNSPNIESFVANTPLFVQIMKAFTDNSLHFEITKKILESGGPGKLIEMASASGNEECSVAILQCIDYFCNLQTYCFKTVKNNTDFLLSIITTLPGYLEQELSQKCIECVVNIYDNLSKNRIVRVVDDSEIFENWILAFSHITQFSLTFEQVVGNESFIERVLSVWISIQDFQIIRRNEEEREKVLSFIAQIKEQICSFVFDGAEALLVSFRENCSSLFLEKCASIFLVDYDSSMKQLIDNLSSEDINVVSISLELCTEIIKKRMINLDCAQFIESDIALFNALFSFLRTFLGNSLPFHPNLGESIPPLFSVLLYCFTSSNKKERTDFVNSNAENISFVLVFMLHVLQMEDIPLPVLRDLIYCYDFNSYPEFIVKACLSNEEFVSLAMNLSFPFLWCPNNKTESTLFVQSIFTLFYNHDDQTLVTNLLKSIYDKLENPEIRKDAIRYVRAAFFNKNNKIGCAIGIFVEQFAPVLLSMLEDPSNAKPVSSLLCHVVSTVHSNSFFETFTRNSFTFYQSVVQIVQTILSVNCEPDILGNLCTTSMKMLQIKAFNVGVFAEFGEVSLIEFINNLLDAIEADSGVFTTEKLPKKFWQFCAFVLDDVELHELFYGKMIKILFSTASVYMMNSTRKNIQVLFTTLEKALQGEFTDEDSDIKQIIVSVLSLFASKKIQKLNYWSLLTQLIHRVEDSWFGLFESMCGNEETFEAFSQNYSVKNVGSAQAKVTKILNGIMGNISSFLSCEEMVTSFIGISS